jgi:hypothetical protein
LVRICPDVFLVGRGEAERHLAAERAVLPDLLQGRADLLGQVKGLLGIDQAGDERSDLRADVEMARTGWQSARAPQGAPASSSRAEGHGQVG